MSVRRGIGWVGIGLWLASTTAVPAAADVSIDDFSQANQTGVLLVADQINVPQTATDSGLSGVIGGVRQLTVEATALMDPMVDNAGGKVDTAVPGVCYNSTSGAVGDFKLLYDMGGSGLGANFSPFLGIRFTPVFLDAGVGSSPVSYTLTLTDGANNSASQTINTTQSCFLDCADVRFLLSDFAGISLGSIFSVELKVSSDNAFDSILGPITLFGSTEHAPLLSPALIGLLVSILSVMGIASIARARRP
jgi:hypothetical protein